MNKITGNECIGGHFFGSDETAFSSSEKGIPIRLHIAAMIMHGFVANPDIHVAFEDGDDEAKLGALTGSHFSEWSLKWADQLIAAYNNTPNPNE